MIEIIRKNPIQYIHGTGQLVYDSQITHQGLKIPDRLFTGSFKECVEYVHHRREMKIRDQRKNRRRNRFYRLHLRFDKTITDKQLEKSLLDGIRESI
jgi:hypothetical protein